MHFITMLALLAGATLASTAPLSARDTKDPKSAPAEEQAYYSAVGTRIAHARSEPYFPKTPPCDMTKASMPVAPSPLSSPSTGLRLAEVVIGRGTQNYTCADSTSKSTPVLYGARATLYNVSCIACTYPELVNLMPNVSVKYPVPSSSDLNPANVLLSGHHFFLDNTTPFFNLNDAGEAAVKRDSQTPAPDASRSVPWLKLIAKNATTCAWQEIYRVNTAGGVAPKTCEGMGAKFEVEYAAEYWFWK